MLKNILQAVLLAIILTSCQREVSIIQQRPNGDVLLVKTVAVSPATNDSIIVTYEYDNSVRLKKETFFSRPSAASAMLPASSEYIRDSRDRITRIKRTSRSISNPAVDLISFVNVFYINDTSAQVAYISDDNNSFKTIFYYNAAGMISKTETHQHHPLPTDPLQMVVYFTYQYDAQKNLIDKTQFSDWDNNGTFDRAISYKFDYDGKVNPVDNTDDALFEARWYFVSPQNCVRQSNDYADPLSADDFVTEQFTYRTDGRPQTAFTTGTSGENYLRSYYYQ